MKLADNVDLHLISLLRKNVAFLEIMRKDSPIDNKFLETIIVLEKCLDSLLEEIPIEK